jgi:hypothetical protein
MPAVVMTRQRVTPARRNRRGGFTAFEVLLATAILAFVSISVSSALWAGRQQTAAARYTVYGSFLAQQLMEEITRLQLASSGVVLGPESGETSRSLYDGPDDYAGYTDGVGTSTPTVTDLAGNAYPSEYQVFTRTVTMTATSYTPTNWGRTINGYLVTVTVSKDGVTYAKLEQFICP